MEKVLRTHVYLMCPRDYEMSGCPTCKNPDPEWSEFQKHLWCSVCKIDFIPVCSGILDGPVGMQLCRMMGITFDSYVLASDEIERYDYDKKVWFLEPAPKEKL